MVFYRFLCFLSLFFCLFIFLGFLANFFLLSVLLRLIARTIGHKGISHLKQLFFGIILLGIRLAFGLHMSLFQGYQFLDLMNLNLNVFLLFLNHIIEFHPLTGECVYLFCDFTYFFQLVLNLLFMIHQLFLLSLQVFFLNVQNFLVFNQLLVQFVYLLSEFFFHFVFQLHLQVQSLIFDLQLIKPLEHDFSQIV